MIQKATRTNVVIWVPMPHNKLLKATLSDVVVSDYRSVGSNDGSAATELITFRAESGKLRSV